jgi:hypothetical protein
MRKLIKESLDKHKEDLLNKYATKVIANHEFTIEEEDATIFGKIVDYEIYRDREDIELFFYYKIEIGEESFAIVTAQPDDNDYTAMAFRNYFDSEDEENEDEEEYDDDEGVEIEVGALKYSMDYAPSYKDNRIRKYVQTYLLQLTSRFASYFSINKYDFDFEMDYL